MSRRAVLPAALSLGLALGLFLAACNPAADDGDPAPGNDGPVLSDTAAASVTWSSTATAYRGGDGLRVAYECPADGFFASVWGTDVYTDDSSVCTAAVHAEKITKETGGRVVIEIRPGEDSYESSTRNGVTTSSWPSWTGSYVFP